MRDRLTNFNVSKLAAGIDSDVIDMRAGARLHVLPKDLRIVLRADVDVDTAVLTLKGGATPDDLVEIGSRTFRDMKAYTPVKEHFVIEHDQYLAVNITSATTGEVFDAWLEFGA